MSRSCRFRWVCLLAVCCLLAAAGVRAQESVDFAAVAVRQQIVSHLEVLEDRAATLLPAQALVQQGWQPATRGSLNHGVSKSAIWLKLRVENRSQKPLSRWFTLGSPRLEWVDFYRFGPTAAVPLEHARSGLARSVESRLSQQFDLALEM